MATHSSILAWGIPWTEQPSVYSPGGHKRVGHDLVAKEQQQHIFLNFQFLFIFCDAHLNAHLLYQDFSALVSYPFSELANSLFKST